MMELLTGDYGFPIRQPMVIGPRNRSSGGLLIRV
jgi:hypothetical protein